MRKMRQVERTELSDQRMVEAAIEIMLRGGIRGLRLTEVGIRAGYSRGLATMRFGTMGQLLRRVAKLLGERWLRAVTGAVGTKRGLQAIYAAIDTQERFLAPPAYDIRVQYLILFNSLDPGASDKLNASRVLAAQRRDLARWIREAVQAGEARADVNPDLEAAGILSELIGTIFQSLMDPRVSSSILCRRLKAGIASRLSLPDRAGHALKSAARTANRRRRPTRLKPA